MLEMLVSTNAKKMLIETDDVDSLSIRAAEETSDGTVIQPNCTPFLYQIYKSGTQ